MPSRFFDHPEDAVRYAAARPFVHPQILHRAVTLIGREFFATTLDVGCGTGLSTRATAEFAERVIGVDASAAMLAQATPHPQIEYRVGTAEALPLGETSVDLVTVGLAWHWFDAEAFFREARRVLRPDGWLLVYNSGNTGVMEEVPDAVTWFREVYVKRYPAPPRQSRLASLFPLQEFGFEAKPTEIFTIFFPMSHVGFVDYLITQTNIIAAVNRGDGTPESIREELLRETASFFENETRQIEFRVDLDLLHVAE